jgi:hypothetical protein
MKKNLTFLITILLSVSGLAKEGPPKPGPTCLTIIFDTSWSTEQEMPDFKTLSRQAITGLYPGDYIEVILAKGSKPEIRVAQALKTGSTLEIRNICTLVDNMRSYFLSSANVSAALELVLSRMDALCSKKQCEDAAVIVFSDGRLADKDIARTLDLADKFRQKGWSLYFVGTKETSKKLLVAANQGRFRWSLLGEANPALWLQRKQQEKEEAPLREILPKEILSKEVHVKEVTPEVNTTAPPKSKPQLPELPPEMPIAPVISFPEPNITVVGDTMEAGGVGYKFRAVVESEISPSQAQHETVKVIPSVPAEPNTASVQAPEAVVDQPPEQEMPQEPAKEPESPAPAKLKDKWLFKSRYWWIVLPIAALLTLGVLALLKNLRNASTWKTKVGSHSRKRQDQAPGILMANVNGQSYKLGQIDRFKAIHVGSGPDNTIKVPDRSIQSRHMRIYKKGDELMLENLAKTPVFLNGSEVKPSSKQRLVIPSVITLGDKIKLDLKLIKPNPNPQEPRSNTNETNKRQEPLALGLQHS